VQYVQPPPYAVNLRFPRTPCIRFGSRTAFARCVEDACQKSYSVTFQ
jgi:hypothetical protein